MPPASLLHLDLNLVRIWEITGTRQWLWALWAVERTHIITFRGKCHRRYARDEICTEEIRKLCLHPCNIFVYLEILRNKSRTIQEILSFECKWKIDIRTAHLRYYWTMNGLHVNTCVIDVENGKPSLHDGTDWGVNEIRPTAERSFSLQGATVTFHNLCYTVQMTPRGKHCQSAPKEVLHSVR